MDSKYTIKQLTSEEFHPLWGKHKHHVFVGDHSYSFWGILNEKESEKINTLRKLVSGKVEVCFEFLINKKILLAGAG